MFVKPHIISNFLTNEEILELRNLIENNRYKTKEEHGRYAPNIHSELSRCSIEFIMPDYLINKFNKVANMILNSQGSDKEVAVTHYNYLEYDYKYSDGIVSPILPPHLDIDNVNNQITLDYHLFTNFDWAVIIEGEPFIGNTNDLLIFNGGEQIHWRENVILEPGQKSEVITLHYSFLGDNWKFYTDIDPRTKEDREKVIYENSKNLKMVQYMNNWRKERKDFLTKRGLDK